MFDSDEVKKNIVDLLDMINWYRVCLENVNNRIPVRELAEAKAGYFYAINTLSEILELEMRRIEDK